MYKQHITYALVGAALFCASCTVHAQDAVAPAANVLGNTLLDIADTESADLSLPLQIIILMTALTILPALALMMTSFTRIIIVLSILRQALGTVQTPPNQVLIGIALFLTLFVMSPVLTAAYDQGVSPYLNGEIEASSAYDRTITPIREFMFDQTREADLLLFSELSGVQIGDRDSVPISILVPAFVTSELKTAFSNRFPDLHPFCTDRSCCCQHADVHGDDDVIANDRLVALQNHVVRPC